MNVGVCVCVCKRQRIAALVSPGRARKVEQRLFCSVHRGEVGVGGCHSTCSGRKVADLRREDGWSV